MAVDDAGCRALHDAGQGAHFGFAPLCFFLAQDACGDADAFGVFVHAQTGFPLFWGLGDDPFFGVAVWDVVLGAECVQELFALDAEGGFQGVGAVVEACVDDLSL